MRFSISLASASLIPNRFYDKGKRQSRLQRTINLRNMLIRNFRVPVHRGQHMHSLHGPVFRTDHSGGHIQSCDVRTTLRLGAWSEMRRSGGETLLYSPREQDSHCCSMLTGLSCWNKILSDDVAINSVKTTTPKWRESIPSKPLQWGDNVKYIIIKRA